MTDRGAAGSDAAVGPTGGPATGLHRTIATRTRDALRAAELGAIGHRARQVGLLAVATGVLTGLAVAGFDRIVLGHLVEPLLDAPLWVQALGPAVGLALTALALRWVAGGASPSTADDYIRNFHELDEAPDRRLALRPVPGRLLASAATLGGGAALGFEGPSIYLGAAIGTALQRRFRRYFTPADAKVLLVCGAAAGVAAIFKAPATGLVFALEVPYRQDLARRMLLPAMFAAASGYLVFVALNGTAPLLPIAGAPAFDLRDLGGAALVGLLCGACARGFAAGLRWAKAAAGRVNPWVRVPAAGALLAGLFVAGRLVTGESLTIGPGYRAIDWSLEPGHAVGVILALFLLRAVATTAAVGGGGAGGLFVPLVVQGAILGSLAGTGLGVQDTNLFPLLGVAAFLGAGYRVPLAAVVFVAESTGRPGFVVPGLLAAAASQLPMGSRSVSAYQRDVRTGPLERRLALPVTAALRTDAATVPSDATVAELHAHHFGQLHLRAVPVVDGATFRGMVVLSDIAGLPDDRRTTTAAQIARTDWPTVALTDDLGAAVVAMEQHGVDRLAVLDGDAFVGIVSYGEILRLDAILEVTERERGTPASMARSPAPGGE